MYRDKTISVVIPCHNEEAGVATVIRTLPTFVDEIIVVDNDCNDRTAEVSKALGARVVWERKRGYGAAYKAGLAAVTGDITITVDGNGTYPTEQVGDLVGHLLDHEIDFLSASRFPLSNPESMSFGQKLGNMMLVVGMLFLDGHAARDSQSGMWAYRSKIYPRLNLTSDGMPFSEEIKIEAIRAKDIRFEEYHVGCRHPGHPQRWRDDLKNLFFLVQKRFQ
jgi:glycosyltransferase involved in cell wall biosynthesis